MRWLFLMPDGQIHEGTGTPAGLGQLVAECVGAVFHHPRYPPVLVAPGTGRVDLLRTVERVIGAGGGHLYWGLSLEDAPDARVWLWPNGKLIGIGQSVEAVEAVALALLAAEVRRG